MSDKPESATPADAQPMAQLTVQQMAQPIAVSGPDVPPDHLAINPKSPHFNADLLRRGIGIRFKGVVRHNVEEYCISEGWVRVQAGKTLDRKGQPLTLKLSGPVDAWFEDLGENPPLAKV